jgi:hypothetical protein
MLSNVKIQTLGLILVSLIGLLAAAFITSAVETRSRIGQIETVWHSFELERSGKTQALYRMYAALGYGGMIHNIKNFVLRGDPALARKAGSMLDLVDASLDDYRIHELDDVEIDALANIEANLILYRTAIGAAEQMVAEGRQPSEIDNAIRIDDTGALAGLATLYAKANTVVDQNDPKRSKWAIVSELQHDTGFGGMIHDFKNFVLRGDLAYRDRVAMMLARIEAMLAEYEGLETSDDEMAAIADLRGRRNRTGLAFSEIICGTSRWPIYFGQ